MGNTCLKCGHVRTAIDTGTEAECPRCGAIYAKVEAAMAARAAAPAAPAVPSPGSKPAAPSLLSAPLSGARLLALGAVGVAVVAYMHYADHQRELAVQAKAHEQIEQQARELQREAATKARAQQAAERRAAMSPSQLRQEELRKQFHPWDGSHMAAEAAIKVQMHNPDSYQHVKTVYADQGPGNGLSVQTTFRGTNAFGAVVTSVAETKIDDAGRVTSLKVNLR